MSRTLDNFDSQLQTYLRDISGNSFNTTDVKDSLNRRIRELRNRHGIHGGRTSIDLAVFPGVYEYAAPDDWHDFINIQDKTEPMNFYETTPDEFWTRLNSINDVLAVDSRLGTDCLLIKSDSAGTSSLLHNCSSLTDNGTWSADTSGSDATNLTVDNEVKKYGSNSLNFDFDVSQSANNYAAISNSDMSPVDLSAAEDKGTLFIWVYMPDVTYISGVTARWGSSSSAYWSGQATTQYNGQAFKVGWNRVGIAWSSASETGSPDSSEVDYVYVRFDYSASQTDDTDFRVDEIVMKTASQLELQYYSKYLCQTSAGVAQELLSDGDDTTVIDDALDDYLFYKTLADGYWVKELYKDVQIANNEAELILRKVLPRFMSDRNRPRRRYY